MSVEEHWRFGDLDFLEMVAPHTNQVAENVTQIFNTGLSSARCLPTDRRKTRLLELLTLAKLNHGSKLSIKRPMISLKKTLPIVLFSSSFLSFSPSAAPSPFSPTILPFSTAVLV